MSVYYSLNIMPSDFTRKNAGFTLVELLVVISIISILAGALFMVINPAQLQRKSREAVLKAKVAQVCSALNSCAAVKASALDCYGENEKDFSKLGIPNPSGDPTGSTFMMQCSADPCWETSTIYVVGTLETCTFLCSFDFGSGFVGSLQKGEKCL